MKQWGRKVLVTLCVLGLSLTLLPAGNADAVNVFDQCSNNPDSAVCKSTNDSAGSLIKPVINTLLSILGTIAVIMIIVAGIRYTTSGGDSSSTKAAKDTILYAVVGLAVAASAFAIVNYVLGEF